MSDKFLTLNDLAKRTGSDAVIGLVEEVTTFAPEVGAIMGRTIPGTLYKFTARNALPAGPAFRNANQGSDIISSTYEQKVGQCFFLDGQMRVDEAIVMADQGDIGDLLADEAGGVLRQKMIALGSQVYEGKTADTKGYFGFKAFIDSSMEVSAGGSSGTATSAWLIWNNIQGVHLVFGKGRSLTLGEWRLQQVLDSSSKAYMAWVNNISGYIGLACNHTKAIGRVKLCTDLKPLTDALIAQAISKFPIGQRPNMILMNRDNAYRLQASRSTLVTSGLVQNLAGSPAVFAQSPTESNGVPIVITDSVANNE